MLTKAPPDDVATRLAVDIRRKVGELSASPSGVRADGSTSIADLLAVLCGEVLRRPAGGGPGEVGDHLILSKGQASGALCAALASTGAVPQPQCATYADEGSRPGGRLVKRLPGVDFSTGALGHGLSLGLGVALAERCYGRGGRAFVVLGDGELRQGSHWEAAVGASDLGADNLTAIVDHNEREADGRSEGTLSLRPLVDRWLGSGWRVLSIDGHDHDQIREALQGPVEPGRPTAVIAHTIRARGVPGPHDERA
ncbi:MULTISPECIES: transketolase [unclassified Streptomyces]|uniref:transketolase n=1 Tax=unclassified Streptomyces TaxID=2593676 RepID=UPI002E2FB453|nr:MULTISPECIES: transketolase [unclassified Streptomyces]